MELHHEGPKADHDSITPGQFLIEQAAANPSYFEPYQAQEFDRVVRDVMPGALNQQRTLTAALRVEYLRNLPNIFNHGHFGKWEDESINRATQLLLAGGHIGVDGSFYAVESPTAGVMQVVTGKVDHLGFSDTRIERFALDYISHLGLDPCSNSLEILERLGARQTSSALALRGLMALREREHLALSNAPGKWKFGHGNLVDLSLFTMAGDPIIITQAIDTLTEIVRQRHFMYAASKPADPRLVILAQALLPGEYAILGTINHKLRKIVVEGGYRGPWAQRLPEILKFVDSVSSEVVVGIYRASHEARGQVFYAHAADANQAALLAIADSTMQPIRGWPWLLDRADHLCGSVVPASSLARQVTAESLQAGAYLQHLSERDHRYSRV